MHTFKVLAEKPVTSDANVANTSGEYDLTAHFLLDHAQSLV